MAKARQKDPERFLDPLKLQTLTVEVGRLVHLAGTLKIDAGSVIKDGCILVQTDQLSRRARVARWRRLYEVRELVYRAATELRHAAARLDAEWERTEEGLCALNDGHRRSR